MTNPAVDLWVYLSTSPLSWLTLTLAAYVIADWIARRLNRHPLANPVVIAVALVIVALQVSSTPFEVYFEGAQFVHFLLGPATVALAIPLVENWKRVRRSALPILIDYCKTAGDPANVVIVSPDAGGVKAAKRLANHLGADLAFVNKIRPKGVANVVEASNVIGNVAGKLCILLDDMIDTAGTIVAAAQLLKDEGATEVWAMATHGVLSDPATERLKNSVIEKVVITNTLPLPPEKQIDKFEVLSIAPLVADAIEAVFEDESVSEIFGGENQK